MESLVLLKAMYINQLNTSGSQLNGIIAQRGAGIDDRFPYSLQAFEPVLELYYNCEQGSPILLGEVQCHLHIVELDFENSYPVPLKAIPDLQIARARLSIASEPLGFRKPLECNLDISFCAGEEKIASRRVPIIWRPNLL